jgi:hypothetical protein
MATLWATDHGSGQLLTLRSLAGTGIGGVSSFGDIHNRMGVIGPAEVKLGGAIAENALVGGVIDILDSIGIGGGSDHSHPLPITLMVETENADAPRTGRGFAEAREVVVAVKPPVVDVVTAIGSDDVVVDRRSGTVTAIKKRRRTRALVRALVVEAVRSATGEVDIEVLAPQPEAGDRKIKLAEAKNRPTTLCPAELTLTQFLGGAERGLVEEAVDIERPPRLGGVEAEDWPKTLGQLELHPSRDVDHGPVPGGGGLVTRAPDEQDDQ